MQKRHQSLLSRNHDFLVSEIPMDATLDAMREKQILSWHDYDQLKTLRHQGRRALARYFLAVLPHRGPKAFQAMLESLQEANAQHLVDLLLQQAGAGTMEELLLEGGNDDHDPDDQRKTPSDSPLPHGPDPHEYAVRLTRNSKYIREFVDPAKVTPVLAQNKILSAREADMVLHLHGRNKKWDLIMSALLQRGERAYQAFMAALLQAEYSTVFHTIQETSTDPSPSDDDDDHDHDDNSGDDRGDKMLQDNPDEVIESDEEVMAEAVKSTKKNSLADGMVPPVSTSRQNWSRSEDALLSSSRDLPIPGEDEISLGGELTGSGDSDSFAQADDNKRRNSTTSQFPAANGQDNSNNNNDNNRNRRDSVPSKYSDTGDYNYNNSDNTGNNGASESNRQKGSRRRSSINSTLNSVQEEAE